MRVVILGGSGYLASCLCFYLKKKNEVTLVTRNKKKINYRFKNVKIKEVNYFSLKSMVKILEKKDYAFHLIGSNSLYSEKNKKKSLNLKKKSTKIILEAAKKTNTKIIYFSTSKVYKNFNKLDVNENSQIYKKDQYIRNHLVAENLILKDIKSKKSNHKVIRLSSVFGLPFFHKSKEVFNLIINSLCFQAINEKKMLIKDPSVIRDFFPASMFNEMQKFLFSENKNNIFNFGYKTHSLIYIAKMIQKTCIKELNFHPKIISQPFIVKKKLPSFKSKYFFKRKKNNQIQNEISKLLKLINENV